MPNNRTKIKKYLEVKNISFKDIGYIKRNGWELTDCSKQPIGEYYVTDIYGYQITLSFYVYPKCIQVREYGSLVKKII